MAEQRKRSWLWLWALLVMFAGNGIFLLGLYDVHGGGKVLLGSLVIFSAFMTFLFAIARTIFRAVFKSAGNAWSEGARGNH